MINSQAIPQTAGFFPATASVSSPVSQLREKYEKITKLYQEQPEPIQRFISSQAEQLGQAIVGCQPGLQFSLPPQITIQNEVLEIPAAHRQQSVGGFFDRAARKDIRTALKGRLSKLEIASNPAVAISTSLLRYVTALAIVHAVLPSGNPVIYDALDREEIPNVPVMDENALASTTPLEKRFFLPDWVVIDNHGNLLVNSVNEAHAHLTSMQQYLGNLQVAVDLAPYIVVDETYQQKRYGMVGQLVNQGRALAWYEATHAVEKIQQRAAEDDLNRGLKLSLPYLDDQRLELRSHDFTIIPPGRYMFVPAFVVLAARREQSFVAQDTRLSLTTRKYLLAELSMLEKAFTTLEGPANSQELRSKQ